MGLLRVLRKLYEGWFTALILTLVLTQGQAERHWAVGCCKQSARLRCQNNTSVSAAY